jgi:hypothetical protein
MKVTNLIAMALLTALLSMSGCKTMEFGGTNWVNQEERPRLRVENPFKSMTKETFGSPQKMTVIWKGSTLASPGNPAVRGFGGRVFFYDADNETVKVDGEMVVYGFDTANDSNQADKKFVFKRDKMEDHYGETNLGHSYSFWVPWDEVGGDQKSVTLIPAFKTEEGNLVKGALSVNMLPGRVPDEPELETTTYRGKDIELTSGSESGEVVQAGHADSNKHAIRETTIRMPKHLGDRIAQLPDTKSPYNSVKYSKQTIEVLNEKGEITMSPQASPKETEPVERKERAPFGKPQAFN